LLRQEQEFQARIASIAPDDVLSKVNHLLEYIGKRSKTPSKIVQIDLENDYPIAFCATWHELKFYVEHLVQLGWLSHRSSTANLFNLCVTVPGWAAIANLAKPRLDCQQGFVAMWFSDDERIKSAFVDGIKKLDEDTGFSMFRIDMTHFNEKICDKILVEIRKSRFLIADVTGHRQGVYFEAGFAMGLGLPVIWTCHRDDLNNCHFDTRQYNHIEWTSPEDLRDKLRDRILATIGTAL
jgi:nucleoside 2-deoxyribosyltransferase